MKHLSSEVVTVEENVLSSKERRETSMGVSRTATSVRTLPVVRETLILVNYRGFRMHVTDALGSRNASYVRKVLDDGHTKLLEISKERYEVFEEMNYGNVVVSINEHKSCVEDYCNVYMLKYKCRPQRSGVCLS